MSAGQFPPSWHMSSGWLDVQQVAKRLDVCMTKIAQAETAKDLTELEHWFAKLAGKYIHGFNEMLREPLEEPARIEAMRRKAYEQVAQMQAAVEARWHVFYATSRGPRV